MIKVELVRGEESSLYFTSSDGSREDAETLDEILRLIVTPFPKRGTFPIGQVRDTLKIDVNTKQ